MTRSSTLSVIHRGTRGRERGKLSCQLNIFLQTSFLYIVIVDEIKKKLHIYELTVPLTMNIDQRNREKTQKYTPFLTDITNYTCTLNCFEVSSTGYINPRNKLTLTTLHSFLRKDMKKSTFLSNLNSLAWYSSYQVWLTREEKEFAIPPFLIPHLK